MSARTCSIVLAILVSIAAFGCERGGQEDTKKQDEKVEKQQKQQPETKKGEDKPEAAPEDDSKPGDKLRKQIFEAGEKIETKLDGFEERLEQMGGENRPTTKGNLDNLESDLQNLGKRIDMLEEAVQEASGEAKKDLQQAIANLREQWDTVMETINQKRESLKQ